MVLNRVIFDAAHGHIPTQAIVAALDALES
jgi:hypothetical protein